MEYRAAIPAAVLGTGADMELEGNLILERRPARRWLSVVAVIVPVLACLAGVTWFIRAFVSPPTIAVPNPMVLAAAPAVRAEPPVAAPPAREETSAAPAPAEPAAPPDSAPPSVFPPAPSVFPPAPSREPVTTSTAAYSDPARESPVGTAPTSAATGIDAAPIADPVPLPRARRQAAVAIAGPVPLPRPRPAEGTSAPVLQPSQPAYSRHSAE
jgi:hypothetical protein